MLLPAFLSHVFPESFKMSLSKIWYSTIGSISLRKSKDSNNSYSRGQVWAPRKIGSDEELFQRKAPANIMRTQSIVLETAPVPGYPRSDRASSNEDMEAQKTGMAF